MTVVYISRHSEPFRKLLGEYNASEDEQIRNEKNPLSVNGEIRARKLSELPELRNVEIIYSSHYVRAMSTAKYVAELNSIKLNVDERLGERKFGVNNIKNLPSTFFEDQIKDWNYKLENGECLNEVSERMNDFLKELLDTYQEKTLMIVSHGTALTTMLKNMCDLRFNENDKIVEIYFNNKMIFAGSWNAPELFKLTFDKEKLINIENIEVKYE